MFGWRAFPFFPFLLLPVSLPTPSCLPSHSPLISLPGGEMFECFQDGNFPKGLPGCGSYEVCTPNMVCYVTHVVAVYKISVLSAHYPY